MPTFRELLNAYHAAKSCPGPFPDQCAIRLGAALSATGVSLTSFRGARCWNHPGEKHILRVEELGTWIGANHSAGRGDTRNLDAATF